MQNKKYIKAQPFENNTEAKWCTNLFMRCAMYEQPRRGLCFGYLEKTGVFCMTIFSLPMNIIPCC